MTHKIFNLSNVLGSIAFILLLLIPGAVEAEQHIGAFIMIIAMAVFAHLSMKEDGKRE